MPLFRPESMRSQDRLHGDVNLAPPTAWQAIGLGMAVLVAATILFLSLAHYSRIATARGVIESDRGVVRVITPSAGTIDRVLVQEGQEVRKGQVLAIMSHATNVDGDTLQQRRTAAVADEARTLSERAPSLRRAALARIAALEAEAHAARTDQAELEAQIAEQQQLIEAATQDLAKVREIAQRGFISQHDVRIREETLANRRQELSRLMQSRSSAAASESAAIQRMGQERADMAAALSEIEGERASLRGRAAEDQNASRTTLVATADGIVSGLVVEGQSVAGGNGIMDIIPSGGRMRVRLEIPAEAVPMVAPGQDARVALDAFPYQTYGTVQASIAQVTDAAVSNGSGTGFIAIAELRDNVVTAYGRRRPIRPGMQVTARIRTMDRTLAQWLLDPLYAVASR